MHASPRHMRFLFRTLSACFVSGILALPYPAVAADDKPKSTKPAPKKKVAKPKFIDDTGETQKQRDKRLTRECKGRPNAGACAGYT
jgi:predicted small lipoprotein YifL